MTTERPSAPKFDMGNPKDEDKGTPDDGDKKKKTKEKKKSASTNEQVLQAQALFDCAGVFPIAMTRSSALLLLSVFYLLDQRRDYFWLISLELIVFVA